MSIKSLNSYQVSIFIIPIYLIPRAGCIPNFNRPKNLFSESRISTRVMAYLPHANRVSQYNPCTRVTVCIPWPGGLEWPKSAGRFGIFMHWA